jgi:hypothetical protein
METTLEKINTIFAMYPNTIGFVFVYKVNKNKVIKFLNG